MPITRKFGNDTKKKKHQNCKMLPYFHLLDTLTFWYFLQVVFLGCSFFFNLNCFNHNCIFFSPFYYILVHNIYTLMALDFM